MKTKLRTLNPDDMDVCKDIVPLQHVGIQNWDGKEPKHTVPCMVAATRNISSDPNDFTVLTPLTVSKVMHPSRPLLASSFVSVSPYCYLDLWHSTLIITPTINAVYNPDETVNYPTEF
ncbi:hypothetical protein TNCV_314501 [Trichonephila clavipes]|nr:hypothetical protein TNCV_314501 [Trichonephila clavipes]